MWNPEERFHEYLAQVHSLKHAQGEKLRHFSMVHGCPLDGLIESRLMIGDTRFTLYFSDAYPPFFDQVAWLEQIIAGNTPAIWSFDDEGCDNFFRVTSVGEEKLALQYMRQTYPNVEVYACAVVGKRKLVLECYFGLKFLVGIDYEYFGKLTETRENKVCFNSHPRTDEIIRPDISCIETWLRSTAQDVSPGEALLLGLGEDMAGR